MNIYLTVFLLDAVSSVSVGLLRMISESAQLPNLVGFPQIYHFGREGLSSILVMDLLGPSLEDLFNMCGRKFSIKTVCMVARQLVSFFFLML